MFLAVANAQEQTFAEAINLEAHGFVSFGYLRTWENNVYDSDTIDGTTEFYEAALNAIARPWERVRLGAQLFVRDLGHYDNGQVELDWAYANFQLHPLCDVQLGRVKIPLGLYNESQDIDAARSSVFLAQSVYPTRLRDLLVSVDGGKVSGRAELGDAGALSYTVFGGTKHFDPDGAYATYVGETSRMTVNEAAVNAVYGGMAQWDTPVPDVALRFTVYQSRDILVDGVSLFGAQPVHFVSDSRSLVASLLWEPMDWTFAAEYLNIATNGDSTTGAVTLPYEFDYNGGYVSATWHARSWLEGYVASEYRHTEVAGRPTRFGWSWIAAINVLPLRNWSLKAEYQYQDNAVGVLALDNPQGVSQSWHLFALKTTVDF
ncbi:MAG: hypothetical protein H0W78_10085 [Planctomycetes bacterium]|nr:hypothetical protein [Planctomycetota bacterium]